MKELVIRKPTSRFTKGVAEYGWRFDSGGEVLLFGLAPTEESLQQAIMELTDRGDEFQVTDERKAE